MTPSAPSASAPTPSSTASPTLGLVHWGGAAQGTRGYGSVRPEEIDNGGDPTGVVTGISWSSWGGAQARGTGTGWWGEPTVAEGRARPVEILAYGLGTCEGHPAYRRVVWWFPSEGQTERKALAQANPFQLCTGAVE